MTAAAEDKRAVEEVAQYQGEATGAVACRASGVVGDPIYRRWVICKGW